MRSIAWGTVVVLVLAGFTARAAHAGEGAPPAPMGLYRPRLDLDVDRCVSDADRERAARAANPQAFSTDIGIYLPPLYWASRDRSFEQIGLVYWKNIDVEDSARFDLIFPLFARLCTPANDTSVAPFGLAGWRSDELGTAGYIGPYFFRRDADAETDTLFPVFWWVRDRQGSTLVAGPWFDVDTPDWHVYGLAPLYLAFEGRDRFFEISPLHLRLGDDESESGIALQTVWSLGPRRWSVLSFPFYFGGRDDDERRSWTLIPPLALGFFSDGDVQGVVAGPFIDVRGPHAHETAFLPLFVAGEGTARETGPFARALLVQDALHAGSDGPFHYRIVPPLLYAHVGDGDVERTLFLQSYLLRSPSGWDAGVLPFWLGGREGRTEQPLSYDIVPPLLFARWSEGVDAHVWFAQTWATWSQDAASAGERWSLASVPLLFAGRKQQRHHLVIPPLAFAAWGEDGVEESVLVGPWLDVDHTSAAGAPGGHDTALVPLAWGGRVDEGGEAAWPTRSLLPALNVALGRPLESTRPLHHVLIPPLLFGHVGDDVSERTWLLNGYLATSPAGFDLGVLPFYLGGREARSQGLRYDVVPPLLFARWGEGGEEHLWFAQTLAAWSDSAWWFLSLPLAVGAGDRDGHFLLVPPLLLADVRIDEQRFTHLASGWLWTDGPTTWNGGVLPFYLGGRGSSAYDVVPPLLFARAGDDDGGWFWLAQTFASWRSTPGAERWSVESVPLFAAAQEADGRHHLLIPPLLLASWGTDVERALIAGPWIDLEGPGGHEQAVVPLFLEGRAHLQDWRDDADPATWGRGLTRLLRPALQAALGRPPSSLQPLHVRVVPPLLYAHLGGPVAGSDGDIERTWFLQSYLARSPSGWDLGVAPLYFGGRQTRASADGDTGLSYDVVPPLLFARWGEHATEHLLFAQTYAAWNHTQWSVLSLPFLIGGGDDTGAHHLVIPPLLLAIFGDDASETIVAGPWLDIDAPGGHDTALLPLFLEGTAHVDTTDADALRLNPARAWGAWLSRSLRPTLQVALGRPASSTAALHHRLIAPLLYGHVGGVTEAGDTERTWFLQSYLARSSAGWDLGIAPLYFGGRETQRDEVKQGDGRGLSYDIVPPLLFARWGQDGEQRLLLAQTYASWNDSEWWLASIPLAFGGGGADHRFFLVAPPLLLASFGDEREDFTWLAQSYLKRSPTGWDLGIAPLYFGGRETQAHADGSDGLAYDVVPPLLFARGHDGAQGWFWFAQSFAKWSPSAWNMVSLPFVFAGQAGGAHHLVIPPLAFARWSDGRNTSLVAGPSLDLEDEGGRDRALLPLFFEGELTAHGAGPMAAPLGLDRTRDLLFEPGRPLHYRAIPLLYAHAGNGETEATLMLQSWLRRAPERIDAGSFPFWLGGWSTDADGPAYQVVPPLLFATWSDGRGTRDVIAGPVWWTGRPRGWSTWALPFYLGGDGDRERRPWYHVVPPLLFAAWGDEGRDTSTVLQFPLYLRHDTRGGGFIDAKTPLWVTWGDDDERRSFFAPLLAYSSHVDGEDWLLAPLVYRRDDGQSSDFVVFPLWWDFKGGEIDATIVSGLWWDFAWKRDGERLQVAPGYLRWEDREETLTIAGPVSWSNGKDNQAWSFHVFPFYSSWSYHPEHIKWRVLFGALGYERERDTEQWMLLWLRTPPARHER